MARLEITEIAYTTDKGHKPYNMYHPRKSES